MNNVLFTKILVFKSLVGQSETERGQSQLIFNWLEIGKFLPNIDKISFFSQCPQKEIDSLEVVQGITFEFIDSLKKATVQNTCWSLTVHVKKFAIQRCHLILLPLEDIVDWVILTLFTSCFINAVFGETLSSRTRTSFFLNLPVMWCKSTHLVHSWAFDQKELFGFEAQHVYPAVICWLICHRK